MTIDKVLEDWKDYDDKKKKVGDARYFACTETWEVDYLAKKIKKAYIWLSEEKIKNAIQTCCRTVAAPHPRKTFVQCVLAKLDV